MSKNQTNQKENVPKNLIKVAHINERIHEKYVNKFIY